MPTEILLAIIIGSAFHALWNIAGRAYRDAEGFLWSIIFGSCLWPWCFFPFVYDQIQWSSQLLLYVLISAVGLALYYRHVRLAYASGEISIVYPLIRSSPLWVALISVGLLGENLSATAWAGILLILAGILFLPQQSLVWRLKHLNASAGYALLASLGTCVYSLSDKAAMNLALSPWGSLVFLALSSSLGMLFWRLIDPTACKGFDWRKLRARQLPLRANLLLSFAAFIAYAITIATMAYAPASKILALTNISLIFGTLAGILFFRERTGLANRIGGLLCILGGVILLKLF